MPAAADAPASSFGPGEPVRASGRWHGSCLYGVPCLPHGIESVASSRYLGSSHSRSEAMRHGLPGRGVMREATSADLAAVATSLAGASVMAVSRTGTGADEASSRTSTPIPSPTSTTRARRTPRLRAHTRTAVTATCRPRAPTLNAATGRTVCRATRPRPAGAAAWRSRFGWSSGGISPTSSRKSVPEAPHLLRDGPS